MRRPQAMRAARSNVAQAAAKLAVALTVVAIVVLGIWVAGGAITNDFAVAMALTAGWMAVAGLVCLAIAWRRRDVRVPVAGAYMLTVVVVGVVLGRSMFGDKEVNERVVTADPVSEHRRGERPVRPRNVVLRRGRFQSVAHSAEGLATAIRTDDGRRIVTLTSFEVDNGPDLRVLLVRGPARNEAEVRDFEDVGALKGNKGDQQYELPRGLDLDGATVVIWCRAFSVNFARAPLR